MLLDADTTEVGGAFTSEAERFGLPSVQNVLNNHVRVEGYSTLEVFAGHAMLTVAMLWAAVPAVAPWDIAYGKCYDVVRHGWKVIMLVRNRILRFAHSGTPCQSMTCARAPALRSFEHPCGLPSLKK